MVQIVEQTYDEKVKMYNKLSKKELIMMLIESNKVIGTIRPITYLIDNDKLRTGETSTGTYYPHYNSYNKVIY